MGKLILGEVIVTQLMRLPTIGGDVLHGMKAIDSGYAGFGEAYFSWVNSGAIKAWKRHTRMTMNLIVPVGQVKFVFAFDAKGPFRDEIIGPESSYARITVPPGIWFGFQGISQDSSLIMNISNISHDPMEVERLDPKSILYKWSTE